MANTVSSTVSIDNNSMTLPKEPCVIFLDIDETLITGGNAIIGFPDTWYKQLQEKKMRFLDLFTQHRFEKSFNTKEDYQKGLKYVYDSLQSTASRFNKESIECLNQIIQALETKNKIVSIVLSSDWKFFAPLEDMKNIILKNYPFSQRIIDYTPEAKDSDHTLCYYCCDKKMSQNESCRGAEISTWLRKHPEVLSYIILDDKDNHISYNHGYHFFQMPEGNALNAQVTTKILQFINDSEKINQLNTYKPWHCTIL
jgi:hypothetical protein